MKNYNGIKNTVRLKFITAIMADSTTSDTSTKCEPAKANPIGDVVKPLDSAKPIHSELLISLA